MDLKKFFVLFSVFTGILIVISWVLKEPLGLDHFFIPKYWVIFGFMASITIMVYVLSWFGIKNGGESQVLTTLGGVVIRLLFSMLIVLFYLNTNKVDPIIFVINFFSLYFSFTVFEIYCLLINLRHQIKK